jgi:dihydropteroate synthase
MANVGWPATEPRDALDGAGSGGGDAGYARLAPQGRPGLPAPGTQSQARAALRSAALAAVRRAVADGARLVDLGVANSEAVSAVRAIDPAVIVCADAHGADLTRDPVVAEQTGATLLRPGPAGRPPRAGSGSARRESLLVSGVPSDVGRLTAIGWAVLVDVDTADVASTLAVAAVCAWLGARIVRTRHVAAVRQAVEMVESIRGSRPPSVTRRGLA